MSKRLYTNQDAINGVKVDPTVKYRGGTGWRIPLQISCGAIDKSEIHAELFQVQANTSQGLWSFQALTAETVSPEKLREFLEDLERQRVKLPRSLRKWPKAPSRPILLHRESDAPAASTSASIGAQSDSADIEGSADGWRLSPHRILAKLEDMSGAGEELLEAIIFAEVAEFEAQQLSRLVPRLFAFVKEQRLSQDEKTKTSVGSAIRKLAMNLPEAQFEEYADLFLPTETDTLPFEIELELAKALLWRLTASPLPRHLRFPRLKTRLAELARDYLRPRLILQKNYASIALHATLGLSLLDPEDTEPISSQVNDLGIGWFRELFFRRLGRLHAKLAEQHDPRAPMISDMLSRCESETHGSC